VDRWPEAAEAADAQEDKLHGASRRCDEMPGWVADKLKHLAKIHEARQALEAEAAAAAAVKSEAERAAEEKREAECSLVEKNTFLPKDHVCSSFHQQPLGNSLVADAPHLGEF
jgi:hypothetical protein